MHKTRLEAFSDGVLAIIITIMVLELKPPHSSDIRDLIPMLPIFLSYVLSFIYVGIYWNNHHHLLQAADRVNGAVLWGNLHLLFWLSMVPFANAWIGENHFSQWPVTLYGIVLLMCAIAYTILTQALIGLHGKHSKIAVAIGKDRKGYLSLGIYLSALGLSFFSPAIAYGLYIVVAIIWLVPDRRIEATLAKG